MHEQTRLAPSEQEFIAGDTMTYLAFFTGDERKGRPYETWTGSLGLAPADINRAYRVDSGAGGFAGRAGAPSKVDSHAACESIPESGIHIGGPHFTAFPHPAPNVTAG